MSDRLWGWTRFLRARGASEQRSQFPSYTTYTTYTYASYCLPYISCYYPIFPISDITLRCTIRKYYYLCETIDKLYTFIRRQFDNDFGFSGCCEYYNVPMYQTVGLWRTFTRHSLTALARELWPNLKPIPLAFVIRYGGDLVEICERVGVTSRVPHVTPRTNKLWLIKTRPIIIN